MLKSSWRRCWCGIGAYGDGLDLMQRLLSAYEEPQRRYHSLQHLVECLDLFTHHMGQAREPTEVEIALWFHDAVYDVKATDNEEQSAAWAEEELTVSGVKPERIQRVKELILATRHSVQPHGHDQQLLVDIDLAILGAPTDRFDTYEAQVRAEYEWVPEVLFCSKRRDILRGFLTRHSIFATNPFRHEREEQARANLARSIERLANGC